MVSAKWRKAACDPDFDNPLSRLLKSCITFTCRRCSVTRALSVLKASRCSASEQDWQTQHKAAKAANTLYQTRKCQWKAQQDCR